jgi:hypothetical protein
MQIGLTGRLIFGVHDDGNGAMSFRTVQFNASAPEIGRSPDHVMKLLPGETMPHRETYCWNS